MYKNFKILWLTGMSGSGKSTLALHVKRACLDLGRKTIIVDGDDIRDEYEEKLGFGFNDVLKNNTRIAKFCLELNHKGFDVVIVPVISPYERVRKVVRKILDPYLHLIYIKANIETLKERDTKGLYAAADNGVINDLIGYSEVNPYNEPDNAELVVDTGDGANVDISKNEILAYVLRVLN